MGDNEIQYNDALAAAAAGEFGAVVTKQYRDKFPEQAKLADALDGAKFTASGDVTVASNQATNNVPMINNNGIQLG